MFTAIVLVCLTGQTQSSEVCYTYTSQAILVSREECEIVIYDALVSDYFVYDDPERGESWEPVDFQCVDWNGKRI